MSVFQIPGMVCSWTDTGDTPWKIKLVIYRLFLSKAITGQSSNIMLIPYVEVHIFPLGAMYVEKKLYVRSIKI